MDESSSSSSEDLKVSKEKKEEQQDDWDKLFAHSKNVVKGMTDGTIKLCDEIQKNIDNVGLHNTPTTKVDSGICKEASKLVLSVPSSIVSHATKLSKIGILGPLGYNKEEKAMIGNPMLCKESLAIDAIVHKKFFQTLVPEGKVAGWLPGPYFYSKEDEETFLNENWMHAQASSRGSKVPEAELVAVVACTPCYIRFFPHDQEHAAKWKNCNNTFSNDSVSKKLDEHHEDTGASFELDVGDILITHGGMPLHIAGKENNDEDNFVVKFVPVEWVKSSDIGKRAAKIKEVIQTGKWNTRTFGIDYYKQKVPIKLAGEDFENIVNHFPLLTQEEQQSNAFVSSLFDPWGAILEQNRENHKSLLERISKLDSRLWKAGTEANAEENWKKFETNDLEKSKQNIGRYANKLKTLEKHIIEAEKQGPELASILQRIENGIGEATKLLEQTPDGAKATRNQITTTLKKLGELKVCAAPSKKISKIQEQEERIEKHKKDITDYIEKQNNKKKNKKKRKRTNNNNNTGNKMDLKKELKKKIYFDFENPDNKFPASPKKATYKECSENLSAKYLRAQNMGFVSKIMAFGNENASRVHTEYDREFQKLKRRLQKPKPDEMFDISRLNHLHNIMETIAEDVARFEKFNDNNNNNENINKSNGTKKKKRPRITCKECGETQTEFQDTKRCRKCWCATAGEDIIQNIDARTGIAVKYYNKNHTRSKEKGTEHVLDSIEEDYEQYEKERIYEQLVEAWDNFREKGTKFKEFEKLLERADQLLPVLRTDDDSVDPDDENDEREYKVKIQDDSEPLWQGESSSSEGEFQEEEIKKTRKRKRKNGCTPDEDIHDLAHETLVVLGKYKFQKTRNNLIDCYNDGSAKKLRDELDKTKAIECGWKIIISQPKIDFEGWYDKQFYETEEEAQKKCNQLANDTEKICKEYKFTLEKHVF